MRLTSLVAAKFAYLIGELGLVAFVFWLKYAKKAKGTRAPKRLLWKILFVLLFFMILGFCLAMAAANVGSSMCHADIKAEKVRRAHVLVSTYAAKYFRT